MIPGWLPVAWGRRCTFIGCIDIPHPEGGVMRVGTGTSPDHLRPQGWWDSKDISDVDPLGLFRGCSWGCFVASW
eukprot:6092331-Pyramimonas_sp.AAC.1